MKELESRYTTPTRICISKNKRFFRSRQGYNKNYGGGYGGGYSGGYGGGYSGGASGSNNHPATQGQKVTANQKKKR